MAGPIDDGFFDRKKPPTKGGPLDFSRYSSAPLSKPLPVVYGTAWVEGVPLYIDKTSSGWISEWQDIAGVPSVKGYASGTQALVQMAFCQGPVTSIDYIRRDKVLHHAGATSGGRFNFKHLSAADDQSGAAFSYQPTFTLGDASTASLWSALSAETNPYRRLAYGHLAMMRCERLAFIGGRLPSLFARVRGKLANYADPGILAESTAMGSAQTVYNALPGDVIKDLLTSAIWGVGLPTGSVVTDVGADGSANSSFDRYCHARGWYIGLAITTAQSAFDVVKMILAATDSTIAVSGSTWKVIPYGDTSVGPRAGYTYTPPSVSIGLTDDDLVQASPDADPVELDQVGEEDTRNAFPLTYVPGYGWGEDEAPAESMDVASVSTTGLRRASARSLPCIRSGPHAQAISALMASRSVYNRTTARFSVNWRHPEVEPGDFVSLTHAQLGFTAKTFRVLSTEEGADGATAVEAVEWNTGVSVVPVYNPQTADGLSYNPTSGGDPGIGAIIDMASDGQLTPVEKPAFFQAVTNIWHAVREGNDAGSGDLLIHGTDLNAASLAFYNYLQTIDFEYAWVDIDRVWTDSGDRAAQRALLAAWMLETTPVVAEDYRAAFGAVETAIVNARAAVLKPTATGSTTARTLMDRFADEQQVKDHGALVDGSTDDAAALQAALDAAEAAGGGKVVVPAGVMVIGSTIEIPDHVTIQGAGMMATTIFMKGGTNTDLFTNKTTNGGVACAVTDCTLDGNHYVDAGHNDPYHPYPAAGNTNANCRAFAWQTGTTLVPGVGPRSLLLDNVLLTGWAGDATYNAGSYFIGPTWIEMRNVRFTHNRWGKAMMLKVSDSQFFGCYIADCGAWNNLPGVHIQQGADNRFVGCYFGGGSKKNVRVEGGLNNKFIGCTNDNCYDENYEFSEFPASGGDPAVQAEYNEIIGGQCTNASQNANNTSDHVAFKNGSAHNRVVGVLFHNTGATKGRYGVSESDSASDNVVTGCDFGTMGTGPVRLLPSSGTLCEANRGDLSRGTAVLVAGTVTVTNAQVRTGDVIRVTRTTTGGTPGHLSVGTITDATSFVVNSSSATDTSTVSWEIVHV